MTTSVGDGALVDLLDRVLDKGVALDADLIISVSGIPLVGLNLRAAVAGMETMLRYGLMREEDREIRRCASHMSAEGASSDADPTGIEEIVTA